MRALFALALLPASAAATPGGFQPGEGLTFSLTVGPVPAGRARMSVGRPERLHGRRLAAVHGEAHSAEWLRLLARLDDDYRLVFDADALLPQTVSSVETGLRERTIESRFEGARIALDVVAPREQLHQRRILPGVARDPLTALFALRAAPLRDGDVMRPLVLDGPALYRAMMRVHGREALATGGGPVTCVRIDVEATRIFDSGRPVGQRPRHITIWLSDDDRRVPYRISGDTDLGTARIDLTSYGAPAPGR